MKRANQHPLNRGNAWNKSGFILQVSRAVTPRPMDMGYGMQ